uniref:Uncharacterized protein n=1 Tax=Picea sitchensis TaxID=3332 RepID=A0A6B9XV97_PICSI|nr:hypothetical protein Q903MT_gene4208 [Picea sitchensis]
MIASLIGRKEVADKEVVANKEGGGILQKVSDSRYSIQVWMHSMTRVDTGTRSRFQSRCRSKC